MSDILIIEDETRLASVLVRALEEEGHSTTAVTMAEDGLEIVDQNPPKLIILDAMLPGIDGFEFLKRIRVKHDIPVLMLTALGTTKHKVQGLDLGADDYLPKPFKLDEFLARVRALLRRAKKGVSEVKVADLIIDFNQRRATRGGRALFLSQTEFGILELLAKNQGQPVSKTALLERIWDDGERAENLVEVYIHYLRQKTEQGKKSRLIFTARGKGYLLTADEDDVDLG